MPKSIDTSLSDTFKSMFGDVTVPQYYSVNANDNNVVTISDSAALNSLAGCIVTTSKQEAEAKDAYSTIDKAVFNAGKTDPSTPSTGVVLDVVLPVASIVLVLVSLCAVAFVGKKKKQY